MAEALAMAEEDTLKETPAFCSCRPLCLLNSATDPVFPGVSVFFLSVATPLISVILLICSFFFSCDVPDDKVAVLVPVL